MPSEARRREEAIGVAYRQSVNSDGYLKRYFTHQKANKLCQDIKG